MRFLFLLVVALAITSSVDGADPSEIDPILPLVARPTEDPSAKIWPFYEASSGKKLTRSCGWWLRGWKTFVDEKALPNVQKYGRVWIHNPGGVIPGQAMRFQQFTDCTQQAKLTGQSELQLISQWDVFSEQMSRLTAAGELVIYIGCPATMKLWEGETDAQWLARARAEIAPILAINPNPLIGFDATYGHPADPSRGDWKRFGGEKGLIAQLIQTFIDTDHEVLVESSILANATWLRDRAGVVATDWNWRVTYKGRDVRTPHYRRHWGDIFRPSEIPGRKVRMLTKLYLQPSEKQPLIVTATLAAGYDCTVSIIELDKFTAEQLSELAP